jgi:DNA-binding transcriptional regulator YiaG
MTIKEAREQAGLSRAEMSRLFEIPVRTLEEWDAGRRTPPPYVEKLIIEKLQSISKERG